MTRINEPSQFRAKRRASRERQIEDFIIARPDLLGFPRALAVRNMRVHLNAGLIDVALLPVPVSNPIKLVLIEAKVSNSADAASKVIGQLLMYYAGALKLGMKGLARIRRFAKVERSRAINANRVSPKAMTGGVSPPAAAWKVLEHGEKIRAEEIALFVAIEDEPRESLLAVVKVLREHGLPIGIFSVACGLIDPDTFRPTKRVQDLHELLDAAERRVDAGKAVPHDEFWKQVEARNRSRQDKPNGKKQRSKR